MKIFSRQKKDKNSMAEEISSIKKPKSKLLKILGYIVGVFLILIIVAVLFIKYDTQAAANFTDNILRPIIGSERTIALEKIFFNAEDKVKQLEYANKNPDNPLIGQDKAASNSAGGNLELSNIPVDSQLKPLQDEGVWLNKPLELFPKSEVMAYTFTRPDPSRSFAITTVVQMDMKVMRLRTVAGTVFPGGPVGKPGPGVIPKSVVESNNLIAAFDGGFQYRDGQYGMIVGNMTYLPLLNNLGTLVGYKDGTIKIVNYTGQSLGDNIDFIRQNCPILIDNGNMAVTDEKNTEIWGRTPATNIYTWRSGVGVTAKGNLVFAVGNNLTPTTLAIALKSAGALNAIQLDINPTWVRFNIFEPLGNGKYNSSTLTKNLVDGSKQYLTGYTKDFFYVYKK